MAKKLVIIDIQYLMVAQTGIRTYLNQLIKLSQARSDNFEYRCIPSFAKESTYFKRPGKFRALLFQAYTFWWVQIQLPYILRRKRADFLIEANYLAPVFCGPTRKIVIIHDAFFWENPGHYNALWWAYFRRMFFAGIWRNSTLVAITEYTLRIVRGHIPKSVGHVLYNCGPEEHDSIGKESLQTLGLKPSEYFLHVGVLEKRKNLPTVVKALRMVKDANIKLVLAGQNGPKKEMDDSANIEKLIQESGLENRVLRTGYLSEEMITSLYQNAIAYVFPSSHEGFGYPILECWANRLPCIISTIDVLREVGGDAVMTANTYEPEDWAKKMEQISEDQHLRNSLIAKGKERLPMFSPEKYKQKLEQILLNS